MFELYEEIGRRIKEKRGSDLRITQEELADRLGISRASLANIESGRQKLTVDQLISFSNIFGVSPMEFIPGMEKHPSSSDLTDSLPPHFDPELRDWIAKL